ncbi:hypothetical protein [Undibacterium sp. TC9W]|uniref:hypothetical protein n=1 Tax=Undibacterium sp. TC9W TaxID=3413053 RepID=UPI003BEF99EB
MDGIGGLVAHEILSSFIESFKEKINEKLTSHRANSYFQMLIQEYQREREQKHDSANLNEALNNIVNNPKYSELFFETYRKVLFAASKDIGPRIIGLLVADITSNDRVTSEDDELIFILASNCSDSDMAAGYRYFCECSTSSDGVKYKLIREVMANALRNGRRIDTSQINLTREVGVWAFQFKNAGFLWEEDWPGETEIPQKTRKMLVFAGMCDRFFQLYQRALAASSAD